MNPLKCAFGVSAGKFLGFIIHEHGIEIDPKSVESIRKLKEPTCKRDVQKLLGKINYLRRFISNLAEKLNRLSLYFGSSMKPNSHGGQNNVMLLII